MINPNYIPPTPPGYCFVSNHMEKNDQEIIDWATSRTGCTKEEVLILDWERGPKASFVPISYASTVRTYNDYLINLIKILDLQEPDYPEMQD